MGKSVVRFLLYCERCGGKKGMTDTATNKSRGTTVLIISYSRPCRNRKFGNRSLAPRDPDTVHNWLDLCLTGHTVLHEIHSGPVIIHGSHKSYTKSEQVLSAPEPISAISHLLAYLVYRIAVVCACSSRCDSEHCWYRALCESRDGGKE